LCDARRTAIRAETLALALAEVGRLDEALDHQRWAIARARTKSARSCAIGWNEACGRWQPTSRSAKNGRLPRGHDSRGQAKDRPSLESNALGVA